MNSNKKKLTFGKLWALLLAMVMVATVVSSPVAASAAPPSPNGDKLVYYDFDEVNSTIVGDASGKGQAGTIRNFDKGGTKIVDDNIYGMPVKALELPGGAEGGYLEIPAGILGQRDAVTVSTWVKLTTNTAYQRIWDFGNNTTSYFYLLSDGGNEGARGYASAVTLNGWQSEQAVQKPPAPSNIPKNRWVLTTVVLDGNDDESGATLKLYENGQKVAERETTITLGALGLTGQNFLGKGQFADPPTKGRFAEFAIYDRALTDAEIASMYDVDSEDYLNEDAATLNPGDLSALVSDFTLPVIGVNGSAISWASANPAIEIVGANAKVTRPQAGSSHATGKLTATLAIGDLLRSVSFDSTVLSEYTDKQMAKFDAEAISLGDTASVFRSFSLPQTGSLWGSTIVWDSSDESVISSAGKVKRPENGDGNATVTLTATVRKGVQWVNRAFECTVIQKDAEIAINAVEPITVTTKVGDAPILPNIVNVTYSDDSTAKLKAVWPATIAAGQYASAGTFVVDGSIIGEGYAIQATVTVVEQLTEEHILKSSLFDLSDVSLDNMGARLKANESRTVDYLKLLDSDRMLYNFRSTFGQDTLGAQAIGGWDSPTGLLRGHSTGHYMSALALAYASTGDPELKLKSDYMIDEMRKLQLLSQGKASEYHPDITVNTKQTEWGTDPSVWGEGYISAYAPEHFILLEIGGAYGTNDIWAPYYTLHKLLAGFIDIYRYTGNQKALDAAKDLGLWVCDRLSLRTQAELSTMWSKYIAGEFGGFNESLATLYDLTGDDRFINGAKKFNNTAFFDSLAKNVDSIRTKHANQHIPQITGALKIYEGTLKSGAPEEYYYDVANNFWHMAVSRYAYSIGGVGTGEMFREPYRQAEFIAESNCETCAAYNMLKLTRDLYKYSPDDSEYMDYYERTLLNQIISSQSPTSTSSMHSGTTYHFPIGPGQTRGYSNDYSSFTCCHGTGMENHVKYQEAAYYKNGNDLYVNLYIPTTLTWAEKSLTVKQETNFPSENTKLTVSGEGTGVFNMKLRVPYWATKGFTVKVNGETKYTNPAVSSYIELKDVRKGDVIDISMPFTYHLDKTPDQRNDMDVASVMYGPLVMVTRDSSTSWKTLEFQNNLENSITFTGTDGAPALSTNGMDFVPLYDAYNYAYHTYFRVTQSDDAVPVSYDVTLPASTPNGAVTASALRVEAGGDVTIHTRANEGYKVGNMTVNGAGATVRADGTYIIRNVAGPVAVGVTFAPTAGASAPMPNQAALHVDATPTAHYTASWENVNRIKQTTTPNASNPGGTGQGWGNWNRAQAEPIWISYTWPAQVTMNKFQIYWYDDGGGTRVPRSIQIQYLDNAGNWQTVTNMTPFSQANMLNQFNTIMFDHITTAQVRINVLSVTSNAAGTGILRWWVSNEIDNAALSAAIADAESLDASDYEEVSYQALENAIAAAELLLEGTPTQDAILSAMQAIYMAKQGLMASPANLNAAIENANDVDIEGYTQGSIDILRDEIANAEAVVTLMESGAGVSVKDANGTIAELNKAVQGLVADKSALRTAVASARLVNRDNYLGSSFVQFAEAYLAAEEILAQPNPTKQAVSEAKSSLNAAFDALIEVEKDALRDVLEESVDIVADRFAYTAASYAEFEAILEYAQNVYDDENSTQAKIDKYARLLAEAIEGLSIRASVGHLENQISRANDIVANENPARYTGDSWQALLNALAEAERVRADLSAYSDTDVFVASSSVKTAIDGLGSGMGGAGGELEYWVETAKALLADADRHIPVAVAKLEQLVAEAEALLNNPSATDSALKNKADEIIESIFQMYPKGDKGELQMIVDIYRGYNEDEFTEHSWDTLSAAITAAQKVLDDPNSIDQQVEKATRLLLAAERILVRVSSIEELDTILAKAEEILANSDDYIASTLEGLAEAIQSARHVSDNPSASQGDINSARDAMRAAISKVRIKPELGGGTGGPDIPTTPGGVQQTTSGGISLMSATVKAVIPANQAWTGKQIRPAIKLYDGKALLVEGTDYAVAYGVNKNIGKGTIKLVGHGKYSNFRSIQFNIVPKKTAIKKITVGKKRAKVVWKKVSKSQKVTGYQISYKIKSKKAKIWKIKNVSAKKKSVLIKKLKKGKRYQFRIRAYKTVAGEKYYGAWSAGKSSKKIKK